MRAGDRAGVVFLALIAVAVLSGAAGARTERGGTAKADALTVVTPTLAAPTAMLAQIANAAGFFDQANIAYSEGIGPSASTAALVSGEIDVVFSGTVSPLLIAKQGRQVSIVFAAASVGAASTLVAQPRFRTLDDLKRANPCRIASNSVGSVDYAAANYLIRKGGFTNCEVRTFSSSSATAAALLGGLVEARVGSYQGVVELVETGKASRLIFGLSAADLARYYGVKKPFPEIVFMGLADNLKKKRAAVVAFIAAMNKAYALLARSTPEQLATIAVRAKQFQQGGLTVSDIAERYRFTLPIAAPDAGYISRNAWSDVLRSIGLYDLPGFSAQDPDYAYNRMVDMSYYEQAVGRPFIASLAKTSVVPAPQGVPAVAAGSFSATVKENAAGRVTLSWGLAFQRLGVQAVTATLHRGRVGVRGPVLATVCRNCRTGRHGTLSIAKSVLTLLTNGKVYVQLATTKQPKGAVRGQIYVGGTRSG